MIIIVGMCYTDNFKQILKVTSVLTLDGYTLRVTLSTYKTNIF